MMTARHFSLRLVVGEYVKVVVHDSAGIFIVLTSKGGHTINDYNFLKLQKSNRKTPSDRWGNKT
jgi:hypothetical protein